MTLQQKILVFHTDKGMRDGWKLTLNGDGHQEPGLEVGGIM